jgi:hypothetical protein
MVRFRVLYPLITSTVIVSGCGTYVPSKELMHPDSRISNPSSTEFGQSDEGRAEADLVGNIRCEIENGIYLASEVIHDGKHYVPYLGASWGTQITLKLTWDETSGLAPGLSFIRPMSNMHSTSIGVGGSVTAHATRVETVTFLFANSDLLRSANAYRDNPANKAKALPDCSVRETGTMIHSDLKIADFIVDKATLASTGITSTDDPSEPPFSTFQEELTFVGSYSGNLTPTWKLTRFTSNTTGNLLSGSRTTTGDVLITLGPLKPDPSKPGQLLHSLAEPAASQHTAAFGGGATATQVNSQTR